MKRLIILGLMLTACGGGETGNSNSTPNVINNTPSDMKIVSGKGCVKLDSGSGATLIYQYENDLLDSGDHFVSCNISGPAFQASDSHLYKAGSSGANSGSCLIVYDVDTASGGYWAFQSLSVTAKTTYNDTPSTHNGYSYTFTTSECASF